MPRDWIFRCAEIRILISLLERKKFIREFVKEGIGSDKTILRASRILETKGLVKSWKSGRRRYLKLTGKGETLADAFAAIEVSFLWKRNSLQFS